MKIGAVFIIILLISLSECLGQSCLKQLFNQPTQRHLFLIAVIFYAIVCYLLVISYQYKGMGIINVLWSGMSILLMVSVGLIFYQETLTRYEVLGVSLIIIGMILIGMGPDHDMDYKYLFLS